MPADDRTWSRRRVLGLGAALGAVAVTGGCGLGRASSPDRSEAQEGSDWGGTLLEPPFEKPDVTFTDFDGKPFPFRESTAGKLSLLFFGYTNCPDVCPVYLNTIAGAIRGIGSGPGSRPKVLFVGVDVARDTPPVLKRYLGNIDPDFIGLTADEHTIATALDALKMAPVQIAEPDEDGEYVVGHPSQVTAFTADDVAHRIYPSNVRQQQWAEDLPRLAKGEWK